MRTVVGRALLGIALVSGLIAGTGSGAGAEQKTYPYTFTNQHQSDSFTDSGLCDPGPASINLIDFNEALHVSATQPGLTEDQIWALLEDDPGGVIVKATYTQTGQFVAEEASGVTYTGRFTSWFGGNVNSRTTVFTGTFSVRGTGDDGSRVSGHFNGHVTIVDGEPVVVFEKGNIKGCPAS